MGNTAFRILPGHAGLGAPVAKRRAESVRDSRNFARAQHPPERRSGDCPPHSERETLTARRRPANEPHAGAPSPGKRAERDAWPGPSCVSPGPSIKRHGDRTRSIAHREPPRNRPPNAGGTAQWTRQLHNIAAYLAYVEHPASSPRAANTESFPVCATTRKASVRRVRHPHPCEEDAHAPMGSKSPAFKGRASPLTRDFMQHSGGLWTGRQSAATRTKLHAYSRDEPRSAFMRLDPHNRQMPGPSPNLPH